MRRRQILAAGGAAAVTAALASCSGTSEAASPASDGASPVPLGTPLSGSTATASGFFGTRLLVREDGSFGLDRAQVLTRPDPRLGDVLRVDYPARSASPTVAREYDRPEGGAQLYLPLRAGPVDALHLRYYLRFPADFNFVKGGKLPGLYGGSVTGGRHIPDGEDGLSTRYMWRAGGRAEVYAYLPTSVEQGTSLGRGDWLWPLGRWICVEQEVRLNEPGRTDGSVTVHLDGTKVLTSSGLEFRTVGRLGIEGVFFSTFFGGSDPSWATPRTQYAEFAAFTVSDGPIGPLPGAP
jgi:hypothetical protein